MSERLFNPDEINPITGNQNEELLPGEEYDIDAVKSRIKIKTDDKEERYYGELTGHSTEELLTMGPEPFVEEFAGLYRKHLEHLEAIAAEDRERKELVENNQPLPTERKTPRHDTYYFDAKVLLHDAFPFFRKADKALAARLENALRAEGINPDQI